MIDHLHIKNFMCFKELEIPTLKRVNLIAGKNNSGKTTLLDAIRILRSNGESAVVNHILHSRKVFEKGSIESYFNLRSYNSESSYSVVINRYRIEYDGDEDGLYVIQYPYSKSYREEPERTEKFDPNIFIDKPRENLVYVPFYSDYDRLSTLWEEVALSDHEEDVYKILRETIQQNLVKLNVGREMVKVRLENTDKPVPLSTLGDGVNRILLIALSLVNAKDSILLIDELELGLHYSALEKLWNMIFKYAQKWNIQVFATTHSQDVLRTFHYVSDDEKYIDDAQYIRLQINRDGDNEAIIYDGERLRETLELQLEIR